MDRENWICLIIGFVVAAALMVPNFAYYYDFSLPNNGFPFSHLTNGANYMAVFFHEIAHTLTAWAFGYPTLPVFDFEYGGGKTLAVVRAWPLIAFFWLVCLYILADSWKKSKTLFTALGAFIILHIYCAYSGVDLLLISFMGHGGELMLAAFFLYRALQGPVYLGRLEQYLNAIFGFFLLMTNARSFLGLMTSDAEQIAYESQKGGAHLGDFSKIADAMGVGLDVIALYALVWTGIALVIPFVIHARVNYDAGRIDRMKKKYAQTGELP